VFYIELVFGTEVTVGLETVFQGNSSISENKGTYPATLSQTRNLTNLSAFSPVASVVNLVRPTQVDHAVAVTQSIGHRSSRPNSVCYISRES